MTETTPILREPDLSNEDRRYLSILENHINDVQDYLCCPPFHLVKNISHFQKQKIDAYVVKISTIGEDRWQMKKMLPCYGEGDYPNQPVGNIWEDYQFDVPTIAQMKSEISLIKDLRQTREKVNCPDCYLKTNVTVCRSCNNTSSVVTCQQLTVRWTKEQSTVIGFSHEPCFLPDSKIQLETNMDIFLQFDDLWPANEKSLDSIFNRSPSLLPQQLREKINHTFLHKHYQRAMPIRRLALTIHHLPIVQCQYHLIQTPGKTFMFCIYGNNQRLHVVDEMIPSISERFFQHCSIC